MMMMIQDPEEEQLNKHEILHRYIFRLNGKLNGYMANITAL